MDRTQKQIMLIESLLSHAVLLRKKIESSDKHIPYKNGYTKTLLDIEEVLSNLPLDLNRLRRDKFGISRMVDGTINSPIEQEMMILHEEIHNLIKVSKDL